MMSESKLRRYCMSVRPRVGCEKYNDRTMEDMHVCRKCRKACQATDMNHRKTTPTSKPFMTGNCILCVRTGVRVRTAEMRMRRAGIDPESSEGLQMLTCALL